MLSHAAHFYGTELQASGQGFKIGGGGANDYLGGSVSGTDINGDGFPDVVVGALGANDRAGEVYVIIACTPTAPETIAQPDGTTTTTTTFPVQPLVLSSTTTTTTTTKITTTFPAQPLVRSNTTTTTTTTTVVWGGETRPATIGQPDGDDGVNRDDGDDRNDGDDGATGRVPQEGKFGKHEHTHTHTHSSAKQGRTRGKKKSKSPKQKKAKKGKKEKKGSALQRLRDAGMLTNVSRGVVTTSIAALVFVVGAAALIHVEWRRQALVAATAGVEEHGFGEPRADTSMLLIDHHEYVLA